MVKIFSKLLVTGVLSIGLLGSLVTWYEPIQVEAASKKVLPDNHTIEQLDVKFVDGVEGEYGSYLINVGERKGTLLIRVDPPKKSWNIQWVNWAIQKRNSVILYLHTELDKIKQPNIAPIQFDSAEMYDFSSKGTPTKGAAAVGYKKFGLQKLSGHSNPPTYYVGMAVHLSKKYNSNGVYYFTGDQYALREPGQVKAYFFNGVDVVEEAHARIKEGGTFPLMNKVMWGKTELIKGQLGKVTVKQPTTLWKQLDNGKLEKVRDMKVGEEYRVYRYLEEHSGLYGVGSGMFIQKDTLKVLYETPSKKNLRLLKIMNGEEK
ncbi:hypothetical protein [Cytobacillus praedii]|uniref:hypothetical protein n=1 Tax=Cytobacillus praedii TaxID=1742358 RepID=UPI002E2461AA|nr:hypothetical protein [Cytobacillus praedii]